MIVPMLTLGDVLAETPVSSAEDALTRIRALRDVLPSGDGVSWFNRLYCSVSQRVLDACAAGDFNDTGFVRALDVVFANLYFDALRAASPSLAPRAWRPLLEARTRNVHPLRFAVAGMNAHINRDLPVALDRTFSIFNIDMDDESPQRRDFDQVNAIMEATEAELKEQIVTGMLGVIDDGLGQADDVLAVWSIAAARRTAWENAEIFEALRTFPSIADGYLTTLDRTVGFAGRALLF
jgi:hypothetical protein